MHLRRIINYYPRGAVGVILVLVPFALAISFYLVGSHIRLSENPADKLMPSLAVIADRFYQLAFVENIRTGRYVFWDDTLVSLTRLFSGLAIACVSALCLGLPVGFIPYLQRTFGSFLDTISLIPPLAVLPILFIVFGLGEVSKVALIVFGTTPFLMRDVVLAVAAIPREQIIKAQTLGASTWQMASRIVFPQILPRFFDSIRLSLGAAWLYLIAAEAIASDAGLGYRIFIVRRYLAMDVILPYVAWITLLAFLMDYALGRTSRIMCRWYRLEKGA